MVRLWFADEARFGTQGTLTRVWARKGSRPRAVKPNGRDWVYVLAATCAATGAAVGLVTQEQDALVTQAFLDLLSAELPPDELALLVWDGGGHHTAKSLRVPANIVLWRLPPYAPELNPVENLWHYLREQHWSNSDYADRATLERAALDAWRQVCLDPARVSTVANCGYAA